MPGASLRRAIVRRVIVKERPDRNPQELGNLEKLHGPDAALARLEPADGRLGDTEIVGQFGDADITLLAHCTYSCADMDVD